MSANIPIERFSHLWRWPNVRLLLIVAAGVTIVISLFELKLNALAMAREVASNFVTCSAITFATASLASLIGSLRLDRGWTRSALLLASLAAGGVVGGLIGWGINELLFSYNISHPQLYLLVTAGLSVVFGLAVASYETVSSRLAETASRLAEEEVRAQRLLRLKTDAELDALRARVNPHFLFNTLNSIASLIPVDPERAEQLVQRLSNLFHYILSSGDREFVSLEEELDIVSEYLEIEKIRLGERLQYCIDRDPALNGAMIPVMLLQPLVENSIKYAVAAERAGGRVELRCRRRGDRCSIVIRDSGRGFDPETVEEGFGLRGVRQRLELNYPGTHDFDVVTDNGVAIHITLPVTR